MQYCFRCPVCKEEDKPLEFSIFLSTMPKNVIQERKCSGGCGGMAKRAFDLEIPTQSVVGLTPISKSTTVNGSLYNAVKFAFGEHDEKDQSQVPFRDSGELQKFMDGHNDLGKPSIDQRTGEVRRRPDGSVIREGAKLIKYDRAATPSKDSVRKTGRPKKVRVRGAEISWQDGKGSDFR